MDIAPPTLAYGWDATPGQWERGADNMRAMFAGGNKKYKWAAVAVAVAVIATVTVSYAVLKNKKDKDN